MPGCPESYQNEFHLGMVQIARCTADFHKLLCGMHGLQRRENEIAEWCKNFSSARL